MACGDLRGLKPCRLPPKSQGVAKWSTCVLALYTYVITVDGQNIAKQVDKDISGIAALKNI